MVLRGLCPTCLVRWTRSPQLPGDLQDSIWVWDGKSGARIQGYELGEEIGRGGSGIVYRARQVSLDRAVAVKLLIEGPFADPKQVERFRLKARAAALLEHPSIVPVHEIGEADGRVFYSMALIEGPTLERVLDRFCLPGTRQRCLDQGIEEGRRLRKRQHEIARFLSETARAIHHAHQHGVLHRDLKPGNILIAEGDRPMITDFGLVWVAGSQEGSGDSGRIHGTPNYIAPELTRDPGRSSVASDVYAVGAIGYELVTGEPPFEAGNPLETLLQIRNGHLTPPRDLEPSLDPDLEAILLRCLDHSPSRRYATAGDLADELDCFARGEVVRARHPGWLRLGRHWVVNHPWTVTGASLAVLTLILMTIVSWVVAERREMDRKRSELVSQKLRSDLEESVIARLQAERLSGFHGDRASILEGLRQLHAGQPNPRILDEAIAQLARVEIPTPQQLHARLHPEAPVALTPDFKTRLEADTQGHLIATDHRTGTRLWEWSDGKSTPFLELHPSPDGGHLIAIRKGRATLLEWSTPTAIAEIPLMDLVGFSPAGDWFLAIDTERHLDRYETRTGRHLGRLPEGSVNAGNIAICPDSSRPLIAITGGGQIRIIDWSNGTLVTSRTNGLANGIVRWVGDWLVHLVDGSRIVGHNLQSGREYIIGQFTSPVMTLRPVPRRHQITATTTSGESGLFDLDLRTRILGFQNMEPLQFNADGNTVMMAIQDSWAIVPCHSSEVLVSLFPADTGQDSIRDLGFSPRGDTLLVTKQAGVHLVPLGEDRDPGFLPAMGAVEASWVGETDEIAVQTRGSIRWHGLKPGTLQPLPEPIHVWDCPGDGWMDPGCLCPSTPSLMVIRPDSRLEEIHLGERRSLRVIEDARLKGARTVDHYGDEILFDSRNRSTIYSLNGLLDRLGHRPEERIAGFRFSPDGTSLLLSSRSQIRRIPTDSGATQWSQTKGKIIGEGERVIAWSPDSKHVALVTGPDRIGIFRASDGTRIAQLTHSFEIHVTALAFSPGNRWIAIGLENGSLHLWNLHRLQTELHSLAGLVDDETKSASAVQETGGRPGGRRWAQTGTRLGLTPVVVPGRAPLCTPAQLDLGPLRDGILPSRVLDSAGSRVDPHGFVIHDGTPFDARWAVHLESRGSRLTFEPAIPLIKHQLDGTAVRQVHVLANVNLAPTSVRRPVELARLRLRYKDGPPVEFPIRLGIEVEDVWSQDTDTIEPRPRVAWRGMDSSAELNRRWVQLYHATFVNPHPDRPVETLEIQSSMALPSLLVSGITLE